jgi:uncharacterized protein (DUF433 family)
MFPSIPLPLELAARATGLSESRIRRWIRDGVFSTTYADRGIGDPKRANRRFVYADVLILRALTALREEGFGLDELGRTVKQLKELSDDEWKDYRFVLRSGEVALERESGIDHTSSDNGAHPPVKIPLSRFVREIEEKIREIEQRSPDEIGHITRNRQIMHGLPVLAGTRIPTSTIYSLRQSGYDDDWILENYPRLKAPDIAAALAFEEAHRLDRVAC